MRLPGDKSLAHRALLCAALAKSRSQIHNVPDGDDVQRAIACLRLLGSEVTEAAAIDDGANMTGVSVVPGEWRTPLAPLDCGNSGTLARLLMGALAGEGTSADIVGDASLSARPMGRVAGPLARIFGHDVVELTDRGTLPARVRATAPRTLASGTLIETEAPSAQVKSAVLFALRRVEGRVRVREPVPTRDHTERMIDALTVDLVDVDDGQIFVDAPLEWDGFDLTLPGDPSSAAFLAAYAALTDTSFVADDLLLNPRRAGFFRVLAAMGAVAAYRASETRLGETVGKVFVRGHRQTRVLTGVDVPSTATVDLIDEVPALAVVALGSTGTTSVAAIAELRHKESDRVARVIDLVRAFGGSARVEDDTLVIDGGARPPSSRIAVRTDGDHRIAMAAHVLARALDVDVDLDVPGCERTSFPGFAAALDLLDAAERKP